MNAKISAIGRLPNDDFARQPYWWDETPPWTPPPQTLASHCDVAVIGGGIAGLSTALELARNGVATVLLEADALGFNASARNSGGVSLAIDTNKMARWHRWAGDGNAPAIADLVRGAADSLDYVETFIARNGIDCDYHRRGRLSCAPTRDYYDILAQRAERLNKLVDMGAHMVPRSEQRTEIGSDSFFGVMVVERSGQLNPARYQRGVAERCLQAGVSLHAQTAVQQIERSASAGFKLTTNAGTLQAAEVVAATNAHAIRLPGEFARRIVPVASHVIVTEPLDDTLAEGLLPKRRTGADNRRLLAYFRRTPDGRRLLYGGRASPLEVSEAQTAAILYRKMVQQFPQLDGVRLGHAWGCKVAFTFDGIPHMGAQDGLHYIMGCNGNGVAMMSYLGYQMGRKILTRAKSTCVFDQPNFPSRRFTTAGPGFCQSWRPLSARSIGSIRCARDSNRTAGPR